MVVKGTGSGSSGLALLMSDMDSDAEGTLQGHEDQAGAETQKTVEAPGREGPASLEKKN